MSDLTAILIIVAICIAFSVAIGILWKVAQQRVATSQKSAASIINEAEDRQKKTVARGKGRSPSPA